MLQTLKLNNKKKEKIFVLPRKKFGRIDSWSARLNTTIPYKKVINVIAIKLVLFIIIALFSDVENTQA